MAPGATRAQTVLNNRAQKRSIMRGKHLDRKYKQGLVLLKSPSRKSRDSMGIHYRAVRKMLERNGHI